MTTLWRAQELVEATGGTMPVPFNASGVSIDTRTLAEGDLFVALRGERGDGHGYVAEAFAKGAAGALVHQDVPGSGPLLRVDDTLTALGLLGTCGRRRFCGRVAAVTGSVGKTTTKEMLRCTLAAFATVHAAAASHNNHWGVPLTLARLPREAGFCVVEIGMNHAGEIAPLAAIARPHVSLITAVENAHIGYLGTLEAIAEEKASICSALAADGVAVLPVDSPMFPRLAAAASGRRIIGFGAAPSAVVRFVAIETDADSSTVMAEIRGRKLHFRLNAPGRHMAMNALAALAVIEALGLDARAAAQSLAGFAPLAGRGVRRRIAVSGGTALLLDESYNGNSASMRAALAVLALQPAQRRIAVLGDMLELGAAGAAEHVALAPNVAEAADLVFACGPLMRHLFSAVPPAQRGAHAADSASLAPLVARALAPGDAVLVKGSLGSRMRQVVEAVESRGPAKGAEAA